jgi:hypothetical protein
MTRPHAAEEEDKPLDPAVEKVRRKLVRFVAVNLGILLVALMVVLGALVYKNRGTPAGTGSADIAVPDDTLLEGTIALPSGSRVLSQSLSGGRLSLHVEFAGGGGAIFLYDLAQRRMAGRFPIVPE